MPKVHKKVKEPATDTTAPADIIPFEDAVRECKAIRARIEGRNEDTERDHFRIGEIADKVQTKYKDRTHAELAKRSNIAYSCLKRYLSVYRAWKGTPFGAPGPQSVSYSVLRELAALPEVAGLPNREQIIRDNPDITKREAEQLRRERKGTASSLAQRQAQSAQGKQQGGFLKDKLRYLKDVCTRQEEVRRRAQEALDLESTKLDDLAQVAGELMLSNLRADAKVVVELAELLLERRRQLEEKDEAEEAEPKNVDALVATEHAHPEASVQAEA
jgi:hypothetical protein